MAKLPPMPARDRGGSFSIENPDDDSPIREMFTLGDGLLFITDKCTYRMRLADQIDPKRQNPDLPHNVQQKLFDHGKNSELVRNTLLLAKVMFRKECQPQLDIDRAMQLAFEALTELVSMDDTARSFKTAEQAALDKAQRSTSKGASLALPSIRNAKTSCKTFVQRADHFVRALLNIVRLFYPGPKGMNWDEFSELVKAHHGDDDNFYKVLALTTPLLKLVRNARDCLEHHNKGVTILDFQLEPDGTLAPPTIEIDFRKTSHERCPVSWFMEETAKALLNAFEMIVVHTCTKNVQPFAGMPIVVGLLSEELRAAWGVRFAYGMCYDNGQFVPMG
jgi:hypothetical protein